MSLHSETLQVCVCAEAHSLVVRHLRQLKGRQTDVHRSASARSAVSSMASQATIKKILHSLKERKRQRVGQSNEASKQQRPERRRHVVIASFLSRGAPLYWISVWIFWKPICWKRGDGRRANHDGTLLLCRFHKSVTYQITAVSSCHFKTG